MKGDFGLTASRVIRFKSKCITRSVGPRKALLCIGESNCVDYNFAVANERIGMGTLAWSDSDGKRLIIMTEFSNEQRPGSTGSHRCSNVRLLLGNPLRTSSKRTCTDRPGIIPITLRNMPEVSSDVSFGQFDSAEKLLLIRRQR